MFDVWRYGTYGTMYGTWCSFRVQCACAVMLIVVWMFVDCFRYGSSLGLHGVKRLCDLSQVSIRYCLLSGL